MTCRASDAVEDLPSGDHLCAGPRAATPCRAHGECRMSSPSSSPGDGVIRRHVSAVRGVLVGQERARDPISLNIRVRGKRFRLALRLPPEPAVPARLLASSTGTVTAVRICRLPIPDAQQRVVRDRLDVAVSERRGDAKRLMGSAAVRISAASGWVARSE